MAKVKENIPLSIIMEEAKKGYMTAINQMNEKFKLPMFLVDAILSGILADVRQQKNAELSNDYLALNGNENQEAKKDGANNG